jgi:hypothetical protein
MKQMNNGMDETPGTEAGEPEVLRMNPLVRLKVGDLFLPKASTNFKLN